MRTMKRMRTILGRAGVLAWAVVAVFLATPMPAAAWTLETYLENRALGQSVARYVSGNGSIGMRIKYIGDTGAAGSPYSIEVAADGNIELEVDGALDTAISTDGVIDVSETAENQYGEACDLINGASPRNFACLLVDVRPSASCDNTLLLDDETTDVAAYISEEGYPLYVEMTQVDEITACIGPEYTVQEAWAVTGATSQSSANGLLGRSSYARSVTGAPSYVNTRAEITWASSTLTGDGGLFYIYRVRGNGADATEELIWSEVGGADGVAFTFDEPMTAQQPLDVPAGYRLIVVHDADSTNITAATLQVFGRFWPQ